VNGALHTESRVSMLNLEYVILLDCVWFEARVELVKHGSIVLEKLFLCVHNVHIVLDVERFNSLRPGENIFLMIF
jgi:hypothetical protein